MGVKRFLELRGRRSVASIAPCIMVVALLFPAMAFAAGISVPEYDEGNYTISWSGGSGDTFEVDEKKNSGGFVRIYDKNLDGQGTATSISRSKTNGTYTYRVRNCIPPSSDFAGGCGAWVEDSVIVQENPSIPVLTGPAGINTSVAYDVTWGPSTGIVTRYELYEGPSYNRVKIASLTGTSYRITVLTEATRTYSVKACNNAGCSSFSAPLSVQTIWLPGAPQNLTGSTNSSTTGYFSLSWSAPAGGGTVDNYKLSGGYLSVETSGTSYTVSSANYPGGYPDGTYTFKVQACNAGGCGPVSAAYQVNVLKPPKMPTGISVPETSDTGLYQVFWEPPSEGVVDHYKILTTNGNGSASTRSVAFPLITLDERRTQDESVSYQVSACNASGCSDFSPAVSVTIDLELAAVIPDAEIVNLLAPENEYVGTLEGGGGVSGGNASYSIDIPVPPGVRGMQPDIKLSYSSSTGNGIAGMGWSLGTGSSSISRCAKIPAIHGSTLAIKGTVDDALCWQGQHLILVSGTAGQSGAEYRTEINNFARIVLGGGDIQSEYSYFTVYHKSGLTEQYNSTHVPVDYVPPGGTAERWPTAWDLSKAYDRNQNTIHYTYSNDSYHKRLTQIAYSESTYATRTVDFDYELRSVKNAYFQHGRGDRITWRLASIESKVNGGRAYYVDLSYTDSEATGRSLLDSVQITGAAGNSYPATRFSYTDQAFSYATEIVSGTEDLVTSTRVSNQDYDGDGRREMFVTVFEDETRTGNAIASSTIMSSDLNNPVSIPVNDLTPEEENERVSETAAGGDVTDFDQDGRADLPYRENGRLMFKSWDAVTGSFVTTIDSNLSHAGVLAGEFIRNIMDFDGDGDADVLMSYRDPEVEPSPIDSTDYVLHLNCGLVSGVVDFCESLPIAQPPEYKSLRGVDDYNGDGLPDLLVDIIYDQSHAEPVYAEIWFAKHKAETGSAATITFESKLVGADLGGPDQIQQLNNGGNSYTQFLDINSDNLLDIVKTDGSDITVWINDGREYQEQPDLDNAISFVYGDSGYAQTMVYADYNNDGRQDILVPAELKLKYCYSTHLNGDESEVHVCSGTPGAFTFAGRGLETQDKGFYRFDLVQFVFDESGHLSVTQTPTTLEMPLNTITPTDFNGDGLTDFAYAARPHYVTNQDGTGAILAGYYQNGAGSSNTRFAVSQRDGSLGFGVDLLKEAVNGLGAVDRWQYSPLSGWGVSGCHTDDLDFYTVDRSQAAPGHIHFRSMMAAVAEHSASNGVGGLNSTCYGYEDAMYSTNGRGFDGFRAITEAENIDISTDKQTRTEFHDRFPLNGRPRKSETFLRSDSPGEESIARTINTWKSKTLSDGTVFVFNEAEEVRTYDLQTRNPATIKKNYQRYDGGTDLEYGNPSYGYTRFDTYAGNWTLAVTNITEFWNIFDYANAEGDWWLNKLSNKRTMARATTYHLAAGGPLPDSASNSAKQVTQDFVWHDDGSRLLQSVTTQSGYSGQERTETFEYDSWGNGTKATVSAPGLTPRTTSANFGADGYFAVWRKNAAGHQTTFGHDAVTGNLTQSTDALDNQTSFAYDEFGRIVSSTPPAGLGPVVRQGRQRCTTYLCPQHEHAVSVVTTVTDGAPIKKTYLDLLGRAVKETVTGFGGDFDVVSTLEYDARGNKIKASGVSSNVDGNYFTEYAGFDALGRPASKTVDRSGHAFASQTWSYDYDGIVTNVTLPGGALTASRAYDAQGLLLSTTDTLGSTTYYRYDGLGNKILIQDASGNQVKSVYDNLGRNTSIEDQDAGDSTMTYNGFGELLSATDANSDVISHSYDVLGRMTERRVNGATHSTWTYDLNGKPGTLGSVALADGGYARSIAYDGLLRPLSSTVSIDGMDFVTETAYDGYYGRAKGLRYPSGEMVGFTADEYGYRVSEYDPLGASGDYYYTVGERDAYGNVVSASYGNGLLAQRAYYESTGQAQGIQLSNGASELLINLHYDYADPFGNLTTRQNFVKGVSETFTYDNLQRLDSAARTWTNGTPSVNVYYDYDAIGNITLKSDYGLDYQYGAMGRAAGGNAGPHAVRQVTLNNGTVLSDFTYDNNGNMTAGAGRSVQYDVFNKPTQISEAGGTSNLFYDPDLSLYKRKEPNQTVYYGGPGYQYVQGANGVEERTSVSGNVLIENSGGERRIRYQHYDRLGSLVAVSDEQGNIVEEHAFDAFGKPLAGDWTDNGGLLHDGSSAEEISEKGFTGHEHLDTHKLTHMGGRVYDPALGRFMSADPYIQAPGSTQSQNAYSYVMNNPLSHVDPSGYKTECNPQENTGCTLSVLSAVKEHIGAPNGSSDSEGQGQPSENGDSAPPSRPSTPNAQSASILDRGKCAGAEGACMPDETIIMVAQAPGSSASDFMLRAELRNQVRRVQNAINYKSAQRKNLVAISRSIVNADVVVGGLAAASVGATACLYLPGPCAAFFAAQAETEGEALMYAIPLARYGRIGVATNSTLRNTKGVIIENAEMATTAGTVEKVVAASGTSMHKAVAEINAARLSQTDAVEVMKRVVVAAGKNLGMAETASGAKVLTGVVQGPNRPIVYIRGNGVATFGTADTSFSIGKNGSLITSVDNVVIN